RTWDRTSLVKGDEELSIEAAPAVHARGALGLLLPPVMGTILHHRVAGRLRQRVYISGDTLTGEHITEVGVRHPEIDTAVVHLGGTRVLLHTVTMDGAQGVDFLERA